MPGDSRLIRNCGLILALLFMGTNASQAQTLPTVEKTDAPDWVLKRRLPKKLPDRVDEGSEGLSYILSDRQVHWTEDGATYFSRDVYRINSRAALEGASRVASAFDPSKGEMRFHWVRIIRDGKAVDQLEDLQISVLQREARLEMGVWTGLMTAVAELRGIQVGDIVDFAVSREIGNPLYAGRFSDLLPQWSMTPIAERYYELTWPKDRTIHYKALGVTDLVNAEDLVDVDEGRHFTTYRWRQKDPDPFKPERYTPPWHALPALLFSSMESWTEVVDWAIPLMKVDPTLPEEFATQVDAIADEWESQADRTTELLRLVQDSIRYVSISIGDGSIVPRPPAEVIRLGYGDCKDKSMLLVAALRRLGIEAYPALAHNLQGRTIDQMLPTPRAFNHMLVNVKLNGKDFWVDPTITQQGGRLPDLSVPQYGYVLPLRPGQRELVLLPPNAGSGPDIRTVRSFDIRTVGETGLILKLERNYYRGAADAMRAVWSLYSGKALGKALLEEMSQDFPGLKEEEPPAIHDDRDANHLQITATYSLTQEAFKEAGQRINFEVDAALLHNVLPESSSEEPRTAPLLMPKSDLEEVFHVTIDNQILEPQEDISLEVGPSKFTRTSNADIDGLTTTFRLATTEPEVPAEDAQSIFDFAEDVEDEAEFYLYVKRLRNVADLYKVDEEDVAPYAARIAKFHDLMNREMFDEALTLAETMTKEVKRPGTVAGLLDSLYGEGLARTGHYFEGKQALEKGVTAYRETPYFLITLSLLKVDHGEFVSGADLLADTIRRFPDDTGKVRGRMLESLFDALERQESEKAEQAALELALAFADAGYKLAPAEPLGERVATIAVRGLVKQGKAEGIRDLIPYIADLDLLLTLLVDRRFESLWPDIEAVAGAGLSKVLAANVTEKRTALEEDPDDLSKLDDYLIASARAGNADAGLAVVAPVIEAVREPEDERDAILPLALDYSAALAQEGRIDNALDMYRKLTEWSKISRFRHRVRSDFARLLLWQGRYENALKTAKPVASWFSDRAVKERRWGLAVEVCAYAETGEAEMAENSLSKMEEELELPSEAYAIALVCLGEENKLANHIIAQLKDPAHRGAQLVLLQDYQATSSQGPFHSKIRERLSGVFGRPEVHAKAEAVGRIISVAGSR